jgi:hypothetical protein
MKFGTIQNCTDEQVFDMLVEGKLKGVICPNCKSQNDYSPLEDDLECLNCKELFITPLLNPELMKQEEI